MVSSNRKIFPDVTIVVGLPGSGRSSFLVEVKTRADEDILVFDDFIPNWYTGQAKQAIQRGDRKVILTDPRLCQPETLSLILEGLTSTKPVIVFLDTDPMTCLDRLRQRGDGRQAERSLWQLVKVLPTKPDRSWLSQDRFRELYLC